VGGFEEQLQEINVNQICAYFCQNFIISFFGLQPVYSISKFILSCMLQFAEVVAFHQLH
jgi:hypothetical protein